MNTPPPKFPARDMTTAFWLWIVIEVICFLVLPRLEFIEVGTRLNRWFTISLFLGIGGIVAIGMSSWLVDRFSQDPASSDRRYRLFFSQVLGFGGLLGIAYPLLMVLGDFMSTFGEKFEG